MNLKPIKSIIYVMGVSGCGKSTVGRLLAEDLQLPFFDGDDYHPDANIQKMKSGIPLNDSDRSGWLKNLNSLAREHRKDGAVIACSSLKQIYRVILQEGIENDSVFIYLEGSFEQIMERVKKRANHFMPPELLRSQFKDLEVPGDAIKVSIELRPEEIIEKLRSRLITQDSHSG